MSDIEEFFKWSDEYSVGIAEIDKEHKELVNILNRLFVAVSRREGHKVIAGILDALLAYTQTHFALEERLLQQAQYAGLAEHKEEHRLLIAQLDSLCKKFMVDEKPIYFEMLSFLRTWLREHIRGSDTKYSAALSRAGFSTAAWAEDAEFAFAEMASTRRQWWKLWQPA